MCSISTTVTKFLLLNSFFFLDLHTKLDFLVTEVIICTNMSDSSGLLSFLQSMLSLYACCGFSVPALCSTDDRRHNIVNFSWGSSDSWWALEGIGVPVSYLNVWLISLVTAFCKRIIFKHDLYTHSMVVTVIVITGFLLQLCLDMGLPYISVVSLLWF